jgi:hypothetical protein
MASGGMQDWQSMSHNKPKPYQKPYQKQEQFPKPQQKYHQEELPFNDKPWRESSLTDTEVEELFWRKLVQLGWKFQAYGENPRSKNVVLPCPYCELVMDSHTIITESSAKRMQDKNYCDQVLRRHVGLDCKAILEDTPKACYKCHGEGILQSGEECDC